MIPAFIAPHYNRPDLTDRMLASIDVPVARGLVVDNSRSGYAPNVGPEWATFAPPYTSLGYPGSINFGILQTPDAPWWIWCSNDVVFGPGDLAAIAAEMDQAGPAPYIVTAHFAMGALNRALVELVGLFDEHSFWPLYFDDNDYAYRCHLAGVDVHYNEWNITEGADGHATSMTVHSDPAVASANARSWTINRAAYVEKWGGLPGAERHLSAWNRDLPVWATRPSPAGRAARSW
jgi:hypothetical protein